MLDEECLLPHGTDSGFVSLLQSQTQVSLHIGILMRNDLACVHMWYALVCAGPRYGKGRTV